MTERTLATLHRWDDLPRETLNSHIDRRLITGTNMMIAHIYFRKAGRVPPLFNSTEDHTGRKRVVPIATENDIQALLTMIAYWHLSGGKPTLFVDFRKVYEPWEIEKIARALGLDLRRSKAEPWMVRGFVDGDNSGSGSLDYGEKWFLFKAVEFYFPGLGFSVSYLSPKGIAGMAGRVAFSDLSGLFTMVQDEAQSVELPAPLAEKVCHASDYTWPHTFLTFDHVPASQAKMGMPANHFHMVTGMPRRRWQHFSDYANILNFRWENAEKNEPVFWQIAGINGQVPSAELDRTLFELQTQLEADLGVHFPSFSRYSVVYKVQGTIEVLRRYYPELRDPDYASTVTMGHARYSTNTNPIFERAQPFSVIGHNGEFNTISRFRLEAAMLGIPLQTDGSDSQDVDRMLHALTARYGLDLIEAMEHVFPPYEHDLLQGRDDIRAMYEQMRQAWGHFAQGPAAVAARLGNQLVFRVVLLAWLDWTPFCKGTLNALRGVKSSRVSMLLVFDLDRGMSLRAKRDLALLRKAKL